MKDYRDLKELLAVADSRENETAQLDLLAAIAGRAENSLITVHKEINELAVKGFIKASYLFAVRDYMNIDNMSMLRYFNQPY